MAVVLKCTACREKFKYDVSVGWPDNCPLCKTDINNYRADDDIVCPAFLSPKSKANDKVARDIMDGSERRVEMAAAMALDEEGDRGHVDFSKVTEMENVLEGTWEVTDDGDHDPGGPIEPEKPAQTPRSQAAVTTTTAKGASPKATPKPAPPDPGYEEGDPGPGTPAEPRTATPAPGASAAPTQTAAPATAQPAATTPAFEGYLSDETGEIVAGPFTDELAWADAFHKLFTEAAEAAPPTLAALLTLRDQLQQVGQALAAASPQRPAPAHPPAALRANLDDAVDPFAADAEGDVDRHAEIVRR
jgi:hypothetical protein